LNLNIEIKGLDKLQAKLGKSNFDKAIRRGMERAVDHLRLEIKESTPVLTGQLRASWGSEISADGAKGRIYTGKEYAVCVEYGTWKMKGRFFVKGAIERSIPKLSMYFKESFDQALSQGIEGAL